MKGGCKRMGGEANARDSDPHVSLYYIRDSGPNNRPYIKRIVLKFEPSSVWKAMRKCYWDSGPSNNEFRPEGLAIWRTPRTRHPTSLGNCWLTSLSKEAKVYGTAAPYRCDETKCSKLADDDGNVSSFRCAV